MCSFGHHLGAGAAFVVRNAGIGDRRRGHGCVGLAGGTDSDPAHLAFPDVVADLEPEGVAPEAEGVRWGRRAGEWLCGF